MISDILLVNDFGYVDGGASSVAVQTAVLLRRLGQNVTFVCGEGPICDELIEADVRVVCLNQQSINEGSRIAASVRGIWNRGTFNKMNVILKDYKPSETIVHIHTWTKVLSSSIFSAIKRSGFPMVLTAHDYFSICPNGGLYNYQTRAICKFRPMGIKCLLCNCDRRSYSQKIWRFIRQLVGDTQIKRNRKMAIVYVSEFSRRILQEYLTSRVASAVIYNPIKHHRVEASCHAKSNRFLFIGRVSEEKGPDLFCEACRDISAHGEVIGDGPMLADLRERYPDVIFHGWLDFNEVSKELKDVCAVVLPSRWYETALLVVPEMLEVGIPCIVPDECAASDYIENGKNGLLFKTGNLSDLESKMRKIEDFGEIDRASLSDDSYEEKIMSFYLQLNNSMS